MHKTLAFTNQNGTKASDRAQQAKKKVRIAQYGEGTTDGITRYKISH